MNRAFAQTGFTLLEMAITLAITGVVTMIFMYYQPGRVGGGDVVEQGYQEQITAALIRYAERHFRLPCADVDGDGFEGDSAGCGAHSQNQVGGVPFRTLGLSDATALTPAMQQKYIYGVFRGTDASTDLALLDERTANTDGESGYRSLDDLRYALRTTGRMSAVSSSGVYVTGDGDGTGAANCASNRVANVAFFVAYSGERDSDGNGSAFDGANAAMTWPTGGSLCAAAQTTRGSERYDDRVVALGFAELLGHLTR